MTRRLNLATQAMLPWEIPELDASVGTADAMGVRGAEKKPRPALSSAKAQEIARFEIEEQRRKGYAEGLEQGTAEGQKKGYAAGVEQGQRAAQQRLAEQMRRLDAAIKKLGEPIRALDRPIEDAVVALGLEVARRVLGGEVARSRDYLVRLIREALAKVPIEMGAPKIVLNPADVALVRSLAPDIESGDVAFVGDESIESGGCLVVADIAANPPIKDKRWHPRGREGASQVDLTLAARWRAVMLTLFESEGE